VELQQNEFVIDSDTLQLTLISIGVEVSNLDYTVTPSNRNASAFGNKSS
jgi:hypothetical protein